MPRVGKRGTIRV